MAAAAADTYPIPSPLTLTDIHTLLGNRGLRRSGSLIADLQNAYFYDNMVETKGKALYVALAGPDYAFHLAVLNKTAATALSTGNVTALKLMHAIEAVRGKDHTKAFSLEKSNDKAAAAAIKANVDVGAIKLEGVLATLTEAKGDRVREARKELEEKKDKARAETVAADEAFDSASKLLDVQFGPISDYVKLEGPDFARACWDWKLAHLPRGTAAPPRDQAGVEIATTKFGGEVSRKHRLDYLSDPAKRAKVAEAAQAVLAGFRTNQKTRDAEGLEKQMGRAGLQTT